MATSNRDRVSKGFDVLSAGLVEFVDRQMTSASDGLGIDWIQVIEKRDETKNGVKKVYEKEDPAVQLRVITEEWRVFGKVLSRAQQSLASELREVRNSWAHSKKFDNDDTYRILDTMERLLIAAGSPSEAETIRQMRQDHQRLVFESETKKAILSPGNGVSIAGNQQHGVAVRRRLCCRFDADHAASATAILHHHRLAQSRRQQRAHGAGKDVGGAPWCQRHDQA